MKTMDRLYISIAVLALLVIGGGMTNVAHAQTITTEECTFVDIENGTPVTGSTVQWYGVYFTVENEIEVTDVALSMFKQTTSTNTVRYVLYEAQEEPSSLGAGQPTIELTSPMPLWSSAEISNTNFTDYSTLSDAQRGDPSNWHSESVTGVTMEPGTTYALVAYGVTSPSSSFSTLLVLGLTDTVGTPPCGIGNTGLTGNGQVYTNAHLITSGSITTGMTGCDLGSFAFPCNTALGYENIGFAIYGVEIFPADNAGTIDAWTTNFLASMGMNSPVGKVLVGSLFAMFVFLILAKWGVPWILSLGLTGIFTTFLTAAFIFDPAVLLGLVALVMFGAMLLVFSLVLGGDKGNG